MRVKRFILSVIVLIVMLAIVIGFISFITYAADQMVERGNNTPMVWLGAAFVLLVLFGIYKILGDVFK